MRRVGMSMDGFVGARAFDEYLGEMMTLVRKQDPSRYLTTGMWLCEIVGSGML